MTLAGDSWPSLAKAGSVPALWDALPGNTRWQILLAIGALELRCQGTFESLLRRNHAQCPRAYEDKDRILDSSTLQGRHRDVTTQSVFLFCSDAPPP